MTFYRKPFAGGSLLLIAIAALAMVFPLRADDADAKLAKQLRRPIALSFDASGKWLYVANRDSGSISVLTAEGKLQRETVIGKQLSDFVPVEGPDLFLATDEKAHQLLVLRM